MTATHREPDDRPAGSYVHVADAVVRHPVTAELAVVRSAGAWWLPGGRVEAGETFVGAARREVAEETGLEVEIAGVRGISERIAQSRHVVSVTCAGIVVGGELRVPVGDAKVDQVRWVSDREAADLLPAYPIARVIFDPAGPVPHHEER